MNEGTNRTMRHSRLLLWTAALFAFAAGPAGATTYKWIDENGKVHYSDKVPADAPQGAEILDKQARPLKKLEAPPSPEELKAKAEAEQRARAAARERDEQARKDRALLQSYTSENEIELAKSRAVSTLQAQIASAQAFRETLLSQQKSLAARKQQYAGESIPIEIERESASLDAELTRQNVLIGQRQAELAMVTEKYDTIKQRWREIVADKDRTSAAEEPPKPPVPPAKAAARPTANARKGTAK
jgi:hypothetical protein